METKNPRKISSIGDLWDIAVSLIAVAALAIAVFAAFEAMPGSSVRTTTTGGTGSSSAGGGRKELAVSMKEFSFSPSSVDVQAGTTLVLTVTNKGTMQHDLKLNGTTGTKMLDPGATETVTLGPIQQTTEAWCTVPGHKEAGMVLKINVSGGSGDSAAMSMSGTGAGTTTAITVDPNAVPGAGWKPYDPMLAPAPGGTEHKITLNATEKKIEIAPGRTQTMWTFNDQVPGPTLRGKVGDIFTITLVNKGTIGHSIDFHASETNMDEDMRTIKPGESLVYQFKANHSGIWMYHCGTPPVLHHIGTGMYGAVVIDPPNLPPVAQEYLFVQSELYFSPDGGVAPLDKMMADQWDAVVFNGYYNQYKSAPITTAKAGERIRVWVLDAGPSEDSSFHIVGTQWDTVFKEGAYLLRPGNPEMGGSQSLDLQPAQGGFVEFTFPKDGTYTMVTHKFSSASKGALGVWKVGNVPGPAMSH